MKKTILRYNERPHYNPDFPYGAILKITIPDTNKPWDMYVKEISYTEYITKYKKDRG